MTDPNQQSSETAESSSSATPETPSTSPTDAQQEDSKAQPLCANCKKPESSPDPEQATLKPCTSCKTVLYCSRDCKKAHLKTHKKECAKLAQAWFGEHGDEVKMASRAPPKADTFQKGLRKWQFDT